MVAAVMATIVAVDSSDDGDVDNDDDDDDGGNGNEIGSIHNEGIGGGRFLRTRLMIAPNMCVRLSVCVDSIHIIDVSKPERAPLLSTACV